MLHTSIFLVHAVEVTGDMGTSSEFCTQKDNRFNSDDIQIDMSVFCCGFPHV